MLKFKLLGTAAGGGLPQWNCSCSICDRCRKQPRQVAPRLHLQAAVSGNNAGWFLLNASPDLRFQIEANAELQPSVAFGKRNTPIQGIVLTSADLDQVLGVLLLREFQPLTLYTTALVRRVLEANTFFRMLQRVPQQLSWIEIQPEIPFSHGNSGITCTPIPLEGGLPFYARDMDTGEAGQASLGLLLEADGQRIAYTPSLPEVTPKLLALYQTCDAILVDGTFWQNEELARTHAGTPLARAIGHVPIHGEHGTIALLSHLEGPQKIFVHINNTNPILDPASPEHSTVLKAGWRIAEDGWQWN